MGEYFKIQTWREVKIQKLWQRFRKTLLMKMASVVSLLSLPIITQKWTGFKMERLLNRPISQFSKWNRLHLKISDVSLSKIALIPIFANIPWKQKMARRNIQLIWQNRLGGFSKNGQFCQKSFFKSSVILKTLKAVKNIWTKLIIRCSYRACLTRKFLNPAIVNFRWLWWTVLLKSNGWKVSHCRILSKSDLSLF